MTYTLILFLAWGGSVAIPNYASLEECDRAKDQATANLRTVGSSASSIVPFHAACVPAPRA